MAAKDPLSPGPLSSWSLTLLPRPRPLQAPRDPRPPRPCSLSTQPAPRWQGSPGLCTCLRAGKGFQETSPRSLQTFPASVVRASTAQGRRPRRLRTLTSQRPAAPGPGTSGPLGWATLQHLGDFNVQPKSRSTGLTTDHGCNAFKDDFFHR